MKPILFNTEMTRKVMAGEKTVTRRLIKERPILAPGETGIPVKNDDGTWSFKIEPYTNIYDCCLTPKYHIGDILYVREAWRIQSAHRFEADAKVEYRAGGPMVKIEFANGNSDISNRVEFDAFINKWGVDGKWHPSLHMPKELARTFLRVTDVRLERLNDMQEEDAMLEGFPDLGVDADSPLERFATLWDKTIERKKLSRYGWWANPWVWVYSFELMKERPIEM